MLGDREIVVRNSASASLKGMGVGAVQPVLEQLNSEVRETRFVAVATIVEIERDFNHPGITAALHGLWTDPDSHIRFEAAVGFLRRQTPSILQVRELLRDSTADIEALGLWEIARLGPRAGELLPDLLELLDRDRKPPRHQYGMQHPLGDFQHGDVVLAIGALKEAASPAIPELLRRFDRSLGPRQMAFANCLVEAGVDRSQIVGRLTPLLLERATSFNAGRLLVRVSPDEARHQVTLMLPLLRSDADTVNAAARDAVYGMAPVAGEAVPALLQLLRNPGANGRSQDALISALGEIGPDAEPAVPDFLRLLSDRLARRENCGSILVALGRIGPRAADAIPDLLELANGAAPDLWAYAPEMGNHIRESAIRALGSISIDNREVSAILQALLEGEQTLREAIVDSLRLCGSAATIPTLLRLLHDGSGSVRARAALAIGTLAGHRAAVVAPLIAALDDRDGLVRTAACVALGEIGPPAAAAIPALQNAIDNKLNAAANGDRLPPELRSIVGRSRYPELDRLSAEEVARTALDRIQSRPPDSGGDLRP
jgi:HEAT repeat protein